MYAWDIATTLCDVHVHLPAVPRNPLMVQIPKDHIVGVAALIHYTWGKTKREVDSRCIWLELW